MNRTTTVSVSQARSELADLLGRARYGNERFVIERRGKPMAVLVGMDEFQAYQLHQAADEDEMVAFSLSSSLFDLVGMGASERSDISEHTDEFLAKAYSLEDND
jgi:prevent-host-death family protein